MGSVCETLLPSNKDKILPTKCKRPTLDERSKEVLKTLFCKLHPETRADEVAVNTIIEKYSSVSLNGKTFSTSTKNSVPYIAGGVWNETLFGSPPSPLPESYLPTSNIRPVEINHYLKVWFIIMKATTTITFAYVF